MKLSQLFLEAHALLDDESNWTVSVYARDAQGRPVHPADPSARRWDLEGALAHVSGGATPIEALHRLDSAALQLYSGKYPTEPGPEESLYFRQQAMPSRINDHMGLSASRAVLLRAAQAAEQEGV